MLVKGSKSVPFTSQQSRSAYKSAVLLKFVPNVAKLLMQLIIYSTLNEDHGFDSCYSYFSRKRSWTFSDYASLLLSKKSFQYLEPGVELVTYLKLNDY